MKKMFPTMLDCPSDQAIASGIAYWVLAFLVLPGILTLAVIGSQGEPYEIWMEFGYHGINFVVAFCFFFTHLKDSFLTVQIYTKNVLRTAGLCALVIIILRGITLGAFILWENYHLANITLNWLPTIEMSLLFSPVRLLDYQPILGTVYLVFLAPITVSCLLYGCVFAPICNKRPWLAYVVTAALFLLQILLMVFCLHSFDEYIAVFCIYLPIHLIACWSYQKTDTIWTPIGVHMLSNLVLSLECMRQIGVF